MRNSVYKDKGGGNWEVLVSRVGEYNSEPITHRVGTLFRIFALARPFLPRRERSMRQRGKGVIPSPIPSKIRAKKGEATARRVRAKSRLL